MKPNKQREIEREDRNAVSQAIAWVEILKAHRRKEEDFIVLERKNAELALLARQALSQKDIYRDAYHAERAISSARGSIIQEQQQRIDHLLAENRALQRASLHASKPRVSSWSMVDPDADEAMPIGVRENLKRCEACEP